jgi:hypothetical protein
MRYNKDLEQDFDSIEVHPALGVSIGPGKNWVHGDALALRRTSKSPTPASGGACKSRRTPPSRAGAAPEAAQCFSQRRVNIMRAEILSLADEVKQSAGLLRRHL